MNCILDGESALAFLHRWRGYNQSSLTRASVVSRVQVANIEAGRVVASVATMRILADALDVGIDDLDI